MPKPDRSKPTTFDSWRGYAQTLLWIVRDVAPRHGWGLAIVVALSFASASSRAGAIGLIQKSASVLSSGEEVTVLGVSFTPGESLWLLVGAAGCIFLALAGAAIMAYAARMWGITISFRYESFCLRRMMRLAGRVGAQPEGINLHKAAGYDTRLMGRIVRQALQIPLTVPQMVAALAIMFFAQWWLTLILLAFIAVVGPVVVKLNRSGMRAMDDLHRSAKQMEADRQRLVEPYYGSRAKPGAVRRVVDEFETGPGRSSFERARMSMVKLTDRSGFVAEISLAAMLLLTLLVLGTDVVRSGGGWEGVVSYVLALVWFMVALSQLVRISSSINRFVPSAFAYRAAIRRIQQPREKTSGPLFGAEDLRELRDRGMLGVVSAKPLDRESLVKQLSGLRPADGLERSVFLVSHQWRPPDDLDAFEASTAELLRRDPGLSEFAALLQLGCDGSAEPLPVRSADPRDRISVLLVLAVGSGARLLSLTQQASRLLRGEDAHAIRAAAEDRTVLVGCWPHQIDDLADLGVAKVAVIGLEDTLAGVGDIEWARQSVAELGLASASIDGERDGSGTDLDVEMTVSD
ncbi:MAG: hypothetical protein AAGI17_03165 [Planctomycetota bacterium]